MGIRFALFVGQSDLKKNPYKPLKPGKMKV